ncbi:MAG: iron-containing alcohol dehydrogenase, partial [Chloroflexota bacterium]|nr:iron-containing alcohol dehydrogenase [Chloroflexota bacterium]
MLRCRPDGRGHSGETWQGAEDVGEGWGFALPTRVRFGSGVAAELAGEIQALGARPFVVTDPGVRAAGLVDRLLASFAREDLAVEVFDGVSANPRDQECAEAAECARRFGADVMVGIGGGSPLDAAKAVAVLIANGGTVQEWESPKPLAHPALPIIAVPTTAGTGSEVTRSAVITDTTRRFKLTVKGPSTFPRVALVDPDLTRSVPPHVRAATGMDVLTHAAEAYTCRRANPVSDALALHATRLVARHLVRTMQAPEDDAARAGMMTASLIAGMAFGHADVAAVHCLAEAVGGRYDTPHGVANAVFLPHVFAHNAPAAPGRHADLARALG